MTSQLADPIIVPLWLITVYQLEKSHARSEFTFDSREKRKTANKEIAVFRSNLIQFIFPKIMTETKPRMDILNAKINVLHEYARRHHSSFLREHSIKHKQRRDNVISKRTGLCNYIC